VIFKSPRTAVLGLSGSPGSTQKFAEIARRLGSSRIGGCDKKKESSLIIETQSAHELASGGTQGMMKLYPLSGFYEPASAISHLFGAVLFLVLGVVLLRQGRGSVARYAFLGVYAFACVFLFSMSGVYHMMVRDGAARNVMGRLDHSAIFVLIAGTFTPAHGLLFRGWRRWAPLLLIWSAAATGIALKTVFYHDLPEWVTLTAYLTLGWFGTVSAYLLAQTYGVRTVKLVVYGGVAYSIGAVLEAFGWPIVVSGVVHAHEVFHVAVLIGAIFHWRFVWNCARGKYREVRHVEPLSLEPNEDRRLVPADRSDSIARIR